MPSPVSRLRPLTPWERFLFYVRESDTEPSEFFSLLIRFLWGLIILVPGTPSANTTSSVAFGTVPVVVIGIGLVASGVLHFYAMMWQHAVLRRGVLIVAIFWWFAITAYTILVYDATIRSTITAAFGLMMSWVLWRHTPARMKDD